jgi:hypothetical protein
MRKLIQSILLALCVGTVAVVVLSNSAYGCEDGYYRIEKVSKEEAESTSSKEEEKDEESRRKIEVPEFLQGLDTKGLPQ